MRRLIPTITEARDEGGDATLRANLTAALR
jgi:hypothetical protein